MLSGYCIRPLQSFTSLKTLRRYISSKARNLSYALPSTSEAPGRNETDPTKAFQKQQELLQVLSSIKDLKEGEKEVGENPTPSTDYWHRRNEMPIPVRQEGNVQSSFIPEVLLEDKAIPQILWHDTLNEDQEYWKKKRKQQLELEQSFVDEALLKYKRFTANIRNQQMAATLPCLNRLLQCWIPPLSTLIESKQQKVHKFEIIDNCFVCCLDFNWRLP